MPIIIGKQNGTGGGSGATPEQEARISSLEQSSTENNIRLDAIESKNTTQDSQLVQHDARIEANASVISSQAQRLSAVEDSIIDYSPEIQALVAKNTDQDSSIILNSNKNTEQDARLLLVEGDVAEQSSTISTMQTTLANKADLVSGKIPLAQLPDLPVGRKVSVANQAERLALPVHPDLTIAYESDTADAWVLDAGEDPSVAANWDKLGNAQATGVQSFNGRTGNVAPQAGDYTTAQITTTTDRSFISDADRLRWDNKPTEVSVQAAVSTLRSEVQAGYVRTNTLAANNGVATLDSDGKVVSSQLPPLGLTTAQSQRIDQIESIANLADQKGDSAATNILAVDNRLTQVDNDSKSRDAAQVTRIAALETAPASIPLSQKAAASGVAPLDLNSKIPSIYLPNQLSIPVVSEYTDVASTRSSNTWYTNNTRQDMTVYALLSYVNNTVASYIDVQRGTTGTTYRVEGPAAATTYSQPVQAIVPPGHRYRLVINGGRTAVRWFEITGVDGTPFNPTSNRIWRDVTADRVKGLWYSNSTGNEMTLHLTSDNVNNGGYFNIQLRANSSSPTLDFICNSTAQAADAVTTRAFGTLTVPVGWDYAVNNGNLGTRNIVKWYELS